MKQVFEEEARNLTVNTKLLDKQISLLSKTMEKGYKSRDKKDEALLDGLYEMIVSIWEILVKENRVYLSKNNKKE